MKYYKVIRIHILKAADKESAMALADGSNLEWQKAVEIESESWMQEAGRQLRGQRRENK